MEIKRSRNILLLIVLVLFAAVWGCGYRLYGHSDLPFTEINIGQIENRTLEPKLQDRLHRALTEEFSRYGIRVTPEARVKLIGTVYDFNMTTVSEKEEISVGYSVSIGADFKLIDQDGKIREFKGVNLPFMVNFSTTDDIGQIIASRELAEEKAMADMAMHLVGMLINR